MVVCRDKGICYHCDEKWILDHKCKLRLHLFIANLEPSVQDFPQGTLLLTT
ncbi:hypothetical protein JHK84_053516 [Glycine max]|nr:hypothetical protein JHK86_053495 [Glycine max]KAG5083478.1 hypothetical protein JHK84_053516 [Glycine max]